MALSINQVFIVGNVGRDAETKFTQGGTAKTTFSVATSERWQDRQSGEWKEKTDWHNIVLWGNEKISERIKKGCEVSVAGKIETRSYEKDGETKYVTEIKADRVVVHGSPDKPKESQRSQRQGSAQSRQPQQQQPPKQDDGWGGADDEDVPF